MRYIDRATDFSFIYEEVDGLYFPLEMGRPGIDPVSLFKIVPIQYIFGIRICVLFDAKQWEIKHLAQGDMK